MATPGFYNEQDQNIYENVSKFMPQSKYLRSAPTFTAPTTEEKVTETFGIPNTNAFTNSGYGSNFSGNAFGYGSTFDPVSLGSYDDPSYFGGLPGNVQQYGLPRNFMYDMDPNYKGNEFMTGYQMTTGKNKKLPGFLNFALGAVPLGVGSFIRSKIEKGLNDPRIGGPSYKIGGMDNTQKGLYNALAGEQMLFDGPGGVKTLTGKNFTGKGYLEGQMELADKFGFTNMTDQEIEDDIAAASKNKKKQFEYMQKIEAAKVFKTNKQQKKAAQEEKDRVAGVQKDLDTGSYVSRDNDGYSASDRAVGGGREATNAQGQNAAEATAAGTGTEQGYSQHYKKGGLASIL